MDDNYAGYFDDAEILEKLAENLDDYFHLLVGNYWDVISAKARSILSNPQDVEEVTCDTFVQAYQALAKMIREGQDIRFHIHLKPWLSTIIKNSSLKRYQHEKRLKRPPPGISLSTNQEQDLVEDTLHVQGPSAEDEFVQHERDDKLYNCVKSLSQRDYEIIRLYYFRGLSDHRIAKNLKENLETIKKARQRALKKLRDMMSGDKEYFLN